ncbi:hypothetical protein LZS94_08900 [Aliivibrio fischeri]|uniref:hypothetical protein n=1 Tax=Aliivibrio fischeri TaxID=668 RepID=UPI001F1EE740|nr:hypothetical protein [Aliivibrio fischeri]MCE7577613.1 hypothetical protein [Aliivibrio fischeri]MCE7589850.1 hypothetical protein [Aliivibrio fischeri]
MRSLDLTQLHEILRKQKISQLQKNQESLTSSTKQASYDNKINSIDEKTSLKDSLSSNHISELEKVKLDTETEELKSKLNKIKNRNSFIELQIANEKRKTAEANHRAVEANAKALNIETTAKKKSTDSISNSKIDNTLKWIKVAFLLLLLLVSITSAFLGMYYLYRLVTEEPIIETVTETVTKTVEKEVIPEECTQVRRNGKVYVSCDGVTVKGAPTIAESGVEEIPELINE